MWRGSGRARRAFWWGLALAALGVAAWWLAAGARAPGHDPARLGAVQATPTSGTAPGTGPGPVVASLPAGPGPHDGTWPGWAMAGAADGAANPLDNIVLQPFKADPQGALDMSPDTRTGVERIQALYERDEALRRLNEMSRGLPPAAVRELHDLYGQYVQYTQAVAQTYPPGVEITSIDEAVRQLDGLVALRRQYFGADKAQRLFGQEEQTTREMLALMRQQKDPGLSMDERAAQAQRSWMSQKSGE